MISRCPSCGAPAPDEVRQCRACGWDFIANKKGEKKPESSAPPVGGTALPPARGGSAEVPAVGLGMARLPKIDPGGFAAPGAADENPFALPIARNLGPKPGESLFAVPPPAAEPRLPEAKPKEASAPESQSPPQEAPAKKEPPPKIEAPKPAPLAPGDSPKAKQDEEKQDDDSPAALFLPSSTKEIVVEPTAKRAKPEAPGPEIKEPKAEPVAAKAAAAKEPAAAGAPKPSAGRPSAVYLAALAGGALGLFSVGAIFMMLRSDPQVDARPTGASPFGKRSSGDVSITPVLDEPASAPADSPNENHPPISPAPASSSAGPAPTSLPAPAVSRPITAMEPPPPPKPGVVESAPIDSPKAIQPPMDSPKANQPSTDSPKANPAPTDLPKAIQPPMDSSKANQPPLPAAPVEPSKANLERATATFAQTPRPKPVAPASVANPKPPTPAAAPAAAPKKPAGPQWVFEGVVYDLLSTRGVYGVRLVFVDAEDNEVASAEAGDGGHYRVSMKAGPAQGYALRIVHDDYSGKHIDELDSTSSVRKADLEQRKFLMQAGARSLPWIGTVGKPVRRDMALVPKVDAE